MTRITRRGVLGWLLCGGVSVAGARAPGANVPKPVLVFAASSLTNVVDELGQAFTTQTGVPIKASYAASSVLAKQIEAGAPAEVFFCADTQWVDYVDERKLLKPGTRSNVVSNRLVLIAPLDSSVQVKMTPHMNLAAALGQGKLATGDPDSVPVGRYAKGALEKLGAWQAVSSHIVPAENVRAALALVARGEAALGIVYATDARAENRVKVIGVFPDDTHPPILYPIALTAAASEDAARFTAFVASAAGAKIFRKYGFQPLR